MHDDGHSQPQRRSSHLSVRWILAERCQSGVGRNAWTGEPGWTNDVFAEWRVVDGRSPAASIVRSSTAPPGFDSICRTSSGTLSSSVRQSTAVYTYCASVRLALALASDGESLRTDDVLASQTVTYAQHRQWLVNVVQLEESV